jgi:hypothetical protein
MAEPLEKGGLTTADLARGTEARAGDPRTAEAARTAEAPAQRERGAGEPVATEPTATPLFAGDEAGRLRAQWSEIQTGFVDAPRQAVERADGLVAQVMKRLAEIFAEERAQLEAQWDRGDQISTEDFRVALQRYRSFFDRLLAV